MKKAVLKLASSIAVMVLSVLLLCFTHSTLPFLLFLASLPLVVLCWIDLGREIRGLENRHWSVRILGTVLGVPQALLGLVCVVAGLAIVSWVLYNSLFERQPEYSGGFLVFGISPLLALFGLRWLVDSFRGSSGETRNSPGQDP